MPRLQILVLQDFSQRLVAMLALCEYPLHVFYVVMFIETNYEVGVGF